VRPTKRLLAGLATYLPGGWRLTERHTGGTLSGRYCYWVWLRHLVLAERFLFDLPTTVAEVGPGDSLGAGIAALLTGANRYDALDVVSYAKVEPNLHVLDELVRLLNERAPIPEGEFAPAILHSSDFPSSTLSTRHLDRTLAPERVAAIRDAIRDVGTTHRGISISYMHPREDIRGWAATAPDMMFSQAVMEHVDEVELEGTYKSLASLLAVGGVMSHQIDFRSHGFAPTWDGHWALSDRRWKLNRGRRRYAINRQPLSQHVALIETAGLSIVDIRRVFEQPTLKRHELAPQFRGNSAEDLSTRSALVQAVKKG
jgi:hypothetical protein